MKNKAEVMGQPAEEDKSGGVEQLQHKAHPVVDGGCIKQYIMILQCAPTAAGAELRQFPCRKLWDCSLSMLLS